MLQYAITDRHMFAGDERERCDAVVAQASRLAAQGVPLIQLREKDLAEGDLEALARRVCEVVRSFGETAPKILLNGPAHVAIASGAHGVHLRGGAGREELSRVRQAFHVAHLPDPTVSISCHSLEDVNDAKLAGFDYLLLGPVFEKRSRGMLVAAGLGLDLLAVACRQTLTRNILALGGVTLQNAPLCIEAGAIGIAGIRMFL